MGQVEGVQLQPQAWWDQQQRDIANNQSLQVKTWDQLQADIAADPNVKSINELSSDFNRDVQIMNDWIANSNAKITADHNARMAEWSAAIAKSNAQTQQQVATAAVQAAAEADVIAQVEDIKEKVAQAQLPRQAAVQLQYPGQVARAQVQYPRRCRCPSPVRYQYPPPPTVVRQQQPCIHRLSPVATRRAISPVRPGSPTYMTQAARPGSPTYTMPSQNVTYRPTY